MEGWSNGHLAYIMHANPTYRNNHHLPLFWHTLSPYCPCYCSLFNSCSFISKVTLPKCFLWIFSWIFASILYLYTPQNMQLNWSNMTCPLQAQWLHLPFSAFTNYIGITDPKSLHKTKLKLTSRKLSERVTTLHIEASFDSVLHQRENSPAIPRMKEDAMVDGGQPCLGFYCSGQYPSTNYLQLFHRVKCEEIHW